jgi:fructose-bisphosphate aldolase class II
MLIHTQAISYGVVKVNLDTDMQFAYLSGVRDYGAWSLVPP